MSRRVHLEDLGPDRDALFISDPINGDIIVVGTMAKLKAFKIPSTAEGYNFTTTHTLLEILDFNTYEENDDDQGFCLIEL